MTCDHSGYGARCVICTPHMFAPAARWQAFFEAQRRAVKCEPGWHWCSQPSCRRKALEDGLCWDHLERRVRLILDKTGLRRRAP